MVGVSHGRRAGDRGPNYKLGIYPARECLTVRGAGPRVVPLIGPGLSTDTLITER